MSLPASRSWQAIINSFLLYTLPNNGGTYSDDERATALDTLKRAYRRVLRGAYTTDRGERATHLWSWLHPTSTTLTVSALANASLTHQDIVFTAADSGTDGNDVTVTIASGGSTAATESGDDISITYGAGATTAQVVAACSGLTVATVTGGSSTAATALAETYLSLAVSGTACPSGFGGLLEDPRFGYDGQDSKAGLDIDRISPEEMDDKIRDWSGEYGDPCYWCLRPKAQSTTAGTTYEFVLFPPPEEDTTVYIRYRVDPAEPTDSDSVYPVGNMACEDLILQEGRAIFERTSGMVNGPERQEAERMMYDYVMEDRRLYPQEHYQESYAEYDTGMDI